MCSFVRDLLAFLFPNDSTLEVADESARKMTDEPGWKMADESTRDDDR